MLHSRVHMHPSQHSLHCFGRITGSNAQQAAATVAAVGIHCITFVTCFANHLTSLMLFGAATLQVT
jgi:hypothetical protein